MSEFHGEPRLDDGPVVSQSKVKLVRNAKGDPQWELSVVEGADEAEIIRIREIAVRQYNALFTDLLGSASA